MSRNLFPVRVLVPLSGGKDSQACLKLAVEKYSPVEVRGLLCDTQWEHPLTLAHVKKLRSLYGPIQVDVVTAGSVPDQIRKHGQFPVAGARFCTEELKIWPTKRYVEALAREQGSQIANKRRKVAGSTSGGFEVWYWMHSDGCRADPAGSGHALCIDRHIAAGLRETWPAAAPAPTPSPPARVRQAQIDLFQGIAA